MRPSRPLAGAPLPSIWLRRELLQQLLTMLPLAEASIRTRLIANGKQAAMPLHCRYITVTLLLQRQAGQDALLEEST